MKGQRLTRKLPEPSKTALHSERVSILASSSLEGGKKGGERQGGSGIKRKDDM